MIPGYHTAGLLLHDLCTAVDELAHVGYGCVAIRPHGGCLNPQAPEFGPQFLRLVDAVAKADIRTVLDLDAPFVHDPGSVRGPSLVASNPDECESAGQWILQWLKLGQELGTDLITFSSGAADPESEEDVLERLAAQLDGLIELRDDRQPRLALRPRSGDAIATVAQFERLGQWLAHGDDLLLAADIGEMLIGHELPLADRLARNRQALACVYLCDRRAGVVGDQPIGQGDVALSRIVRSLSQHDFHGPAIVRVEGHAELGFTPARQAIEILEADG